MGAIIEKALGAFKYTLAIFMMYAGVITAASPTTAASGALGWIYSSRLVLLILGIIFFICGFILFYGKIIKSKKWTGKGLLYIYLCFFFAAILNAYASAGIITAWLPNAIGALVTGALWLRWKFKTQYINPNHFKKDVINMR